MQKDNPNLITQYLIEVYSTSQGAVYQSDSENCIYLSFAGKTAKYKLGCLIRLKKVIDSISLERMMDVNHPSIEIIFLCGAEDCFVLDTKEIIELKELLKGTFTMFNLNHMIKDCLQRLVV